MNISSFLKYFPLPKFISPTRVGISFSDLSVKAVFFENGSFGSNIKSLILPLDPGVIKEGIIIEKDILTEKLKEIKQKIEVSFVSFAIPDEITYIFNCIVPVVEGRDATESIAFSIEENIPISLADAVFDFVPISVRIGENGYEGNFIVNACTRKEVLNYIEVLEDAGFIVLGALPESQSVANVVVPKGISGFSTIVHIRDNRVGIYLVNGGIVTFVTIRALTQDAYEKEVIDEYDKFKEYYSKYGGSKDVLIKNLFVCGEFEYAKRAVSIISKNYPGISVSLANIWHNLLSLHEETPNLPYDKSLSFAGSIGATLEI